MSIRNTYTLTYPGVEWSPAEVTTGAAQQVAWEQHARTKRLPTNPKDPGYPFITALAFQVWHAARPILPDGTTFEAFLDNVQDIDTPPTDADEPGN